MAQDLNEEDQRSVSEGLTEEELALFDLLATLKREKLVLDWRKRQQARASVRVTVEQKLDELPEVYEETIYWTKVDAIYQHVYDSYYGQGRGIYAEAG